MTRLAAGPLGPTSTFGTRRGQKVASAKAIIAACLAVLDDDGDPCPSVENVLAAGDGFSRSTLHRERYKPILHAAKARHAARRAGKWREGDEDALFRMDASVMAGVWTTPEKEAPTSAGDTDGDDGAEVGATVALAAVPAPSVDPDRDLAALTAENNALRDMLARRDAELQRRDDQLYHAVQTSQLWSRTIRRLRVTIVELKAEIDTLQSEPWDPREERDWSPADGDDDEWPENG